MIESHQDDDAVLEMQNRYTAAMHAVMTGVAAMMTFDSTETSPKNLRVGTNSAILQTSALTKLLIDKGLITELEWWTTLAEFAENEVAIYQKALYDITGSEFYLR